MGTWHVGSATCKSAIKSHDDLLTNPDTIARITGKSERWLIPKVAKRAIIQPHIHIHAAVPPRPSTPLTLLIKLISTTRSSSLLRHICTTSLMAPLHERPHNEASHGGSPIPTHICCTSAHPFFLAATKALARKPTAAAFTIRLLAKRRVRVLRRANAAFLAALAPRPAKHAGKIKAAHAIGSIGSAMGTFASHVELQRCWIL